MYYSLKTRCCSFFMCIFWSAQFLCFRDMKILLQPTISLRNEFNDNFVSDLLINVTYEPYRNINTGFGKEQGNLMHNMNHFIHSSIQIHQEMSASTFTSPCPFPAFSCNDVNRIYFLDREGQSDGPLTLELSSVEHLQCPTTLSKPQKLEELALNPNA